MKTIIVPTDFSKSASNAMVYALQLANSFNAEVVAIHVIHPTEGVDNNIYNMYYLQDYIDQKKKILERWVKKYSKQPDNKNLKITSICEVGYLSATLKELKVKNDALIVMGTTGASGIGALLGSYAGQVISNIKIPTLLLPAGTKFKTGAKFCLSSNFKNHLNEKNQITLKEIVAAHDSKIVEVLHVMDEREKAPIYKEEEFRTKNGNLNFKFHYTHDNNTVHAITNYLETNNIDILCTLTQHHNLLYRIFVEKSVTKSLAQKAITGILVLHS